MKNLDFAICENKSTSNLMSLNLVFAKIYLVKTRDVVSVSKTISLLRHTLTSATLALFSETVKILIHIKYVKNPNHLWIVRNSERTRKNIPANIKIYSSWKSSLQLILNETILMFSRWKASCRRISFYNFFKDTNK